MPEKLTLSNRKAFETFCPPGEVVEVRILGTYGKNKAWDGFAKTVVSGYFDDYEAFCEAVMAANTAEYDGIYFTLQKIDPRLQGRSFNRLKPCNLTTSDKDVQAYRFILIDIDPVRPSGISSSNTELQSAKDAAKAIIAWLNEQGFPEPVQAMSGNGVHLLYRITEIPVTPDLIKYIQNFLKFLAASFNSDSVDIDTSVFNPARICRLYGTTARKGDALPPGPQREARPHRSSYIINLPEPLEAVSETALLKIYKLFPKEPEQPVKNALSANLSNSRFDVARYLDHYQIKHRIREKNGSTFFCLDHCVFDESHRSNDAAIVQADSGMLTYHCFHSSCQGRRWAEARQLISGDTKLSNFHNG